MNVLLVTPWFPTPVDPVEGSFIAAQAAALACLGHDVSCCVVRPVAPWPASMLSRKWRTFARTPRSWQWNGLEAHRHRYLGVPRYLLYGSEGRRMARSLRAHMRDRHADVILAHTELVGEAVLRSRDGERPPVIVVIHGINLAAGMRATSRRQANLRWTLEQADRVVVVGPRLVPIVVGWGAPESSVRVVLNGFDEQLVAAARVRAQEEGNRRLEVLSVSNLVAGKGVDVNLRALALVLRERLDVRYTVVGDGRARGEYQRLATDLGVSERVRFLGRLAPREVHRELAACDVFSLPSSPEAFGVAYVEAMAHGKPIVGCVGEGPELFCRDGNHGFLVPPGDAVAVAAAWQQLAGSEVRNRLGGSARQWAFHELTWHQSAVLLERLLIEVGDQSDGSDFKAPNGERRRT